MFRHTDLGRRICLAEEKLDALWERPPPPLTVTEISTSALESLVLQTETRLVRGGLSGNHLRRVSPPAWGTLTRLDLGRRIRNVCERFAPEALYL